MSRFWSIPGMSPSGGEGKMGGRKSTTPSPPTKEQLQARYGDYYKNRGDQMTSAFADVGDQVKIRGDNAVVRHVEKNSDGSQDLTVQRSSQVGSGTYKVSIASDNHRTQYVSKIKPTHD